jgi:hypothetical protein
MRTFSMLIATEASPLTSVLTRLPALTAFVRPSATPSFTTVLTALLFASVLLCASAACPFAELPARRACAKLPSVRIPEVDATACKTTTCAILFFSSSLAFSSACFLEEGRAEGIRPPSRSEGIRLPHQNAGIKFGNFQTEDICRRRCGTWSVSCAPGGGSHGQGFGRHGVSRFRQCLRL